MLSALNVVAGALSYAATAAGVDDLTISTTGTTGKYTFSDPNQAITLGSGAVSAGWTGSGTHSVTGPDASVLSMVVDTKDASDTVVVQSIDAPLALNFTNTPADVDTVNVGNPTTGVQSIKGNVTITNAAGSTVLTVDDSADTTARTALFSGGTLINLAPHPISFAAANVSSVTVNGPSTFGTLNFNAGKKGPVSVNPGFQVGSGTILIGGDPPLNFADFGAVNVTNAADQPLTANDQPIQTTTGDPAVEGKALPYLVATFNDADPNAKTANFVATINWGDGSPVTAGTIVADGLGRFDVTATHSFLDDGTLPVVATITDTGTTGSYFFAGIPVTISDIGGGAVANGTITTTNLVSDGSASAPHADPNLINPWGVAHSPTGPNWVADNGTGVATLYDGTGQPFPSGSPLVVTIPPPGGKVGPSTPTGIAFNPTPGFVVSSGGASGPATFLFATQDGTISGWNPSVPPGSHQAILAVDNSTSGAVYTGLALAGTGSTALLYAANFHSGHVDVFNEGFANVSTAGSFVDPTLPVGYAPYGIQAIGGNILVTFARRDATGLDAMAGLGSGYVDVFSTSGALLKHLISNAPLNAPWGLALAPAGFGQFGGDLLVANHGDGLVNAFDASTGVFEGTFIDSTSNPVALDGLRGLIFGNGGTAGASNTLTFTSGPSAGAGGLIGDLAATPETTTVLDAPIRATITNVSAIQGVPFNGVVASFTDDNPRTSAGDYTAMISWGDGTTTAGTIKPGTAPGNTFIVTGTHTFAANTVGQPPDILTVTIMEQDGDSSVQVQGTATVAIQPTVHPTITNVSAVEGEPFNGVVASFTDDTPKLGPGDFNASIDWGDGTTTSGTINQSSTPGTSFFVTGTHTYAEETTGRPPLILRVTITEKDNGSTGTVQGTATIADARLLPFGTPLTLSTVEGIPLVNVLVGRFLDENPSTPPSDFNGAFSPIITWGDGKNSPGTVVADPTIAGVFDVIGSHIYADETTNSPPNTISIAVKDAGGSTTTVVGTALVADAPLSVVTAPALPNNPATPIVEGSKPFTGDVATFTDGNPQGKNSDFTATINWGDGTLPTTGSIAEDGHGVFHVTGTHTYGEEGTFPVVVRVRDIGGASLVIAGAATVQDAPLTITGVNGKATEGVKFTAKVATFTDTNPNARLADFSVTINWGDKTALDRKGVITQPGGVGTTFFITGTHTYAEEGMFTPIVTVTDVGGRSAVTDPGVFTVADAALRAAANQPAAPKPTEGTAFTAPLAIFTDANPKAPMTDFSATVDWGDGSTSAGTIAQAGGVGTPITVMGTHTYKEEGKFKITVTLKDVGGSMATAGPMVTVADAALAKIPLGPIAAVAGKPLIDQFVSTFTDANPMATVADFTATIDWKDGTPVTAGVIVAGAGNAFFDVTGTHTYAREGVYMAVVTIKDVGGASLPNDPEIDVADAPLSSIGAPSVPALVGIPLDNNPGGRPVLATFTDADNTSSVNDFANAKLTVFWGDGTSNSFGGGAVSIGIFGSSPHGTTYFVKGNHTYTSPGDYQILVDVVDQGGSATEATSEAIVAPAPPPVIAFTPVPVIAVEGQAQANLKVATFTAVPMVPAGDLSASIDWGDGSPKSSGTVTLAGGVYTLAGNHTYAEAQAAAYPISFTVFDKSGDRTSGTTKATVADAMLGGLAVIPFKATEGKPFNLIQVATFTDANPQAPSSDFTASIDWGDGASAGIVVRTGDTAAGSTFVVLGSHTYSDEGPYTIGVKITDDDSPGAPLNGNMPAAATVADAPLTVSIAGPILAIQGQPIPGATHLITFTDANPLADVNDFTVTVDWGDGTMAAIPPTALGGGVFTVDAGHTYMQLGDFTLTVKVQDKGGSKTIASAEVDVDPAVSGGIPIGDAAPSTLGRATVAARGASPSTAVPVVSARSTALKRPAGLAPQGAGPLKIIVPSSHRTEVSRPVPVMLHDLALAEVVASTTRRRPA